MFELSLRMMPQVLLIIMLSAGSGSAISCYLCRNCVDNGTLNPCSSVSNACSKIVTNGMISRDCAIAQDGCTTVRNTVTCYCSNRDGCNDGGVSSANTTFEISCYVCQNCTDNGVLTKCSSKSDACVKSETNGVINRNCAIAATQGCWTLNNNDGTSTTSCNCWNKDGCNGVGMIKVSGIFALALAFIASQLI